MRVHREVTYPKSPKDKNVCKWGFVWGSKGVREEVGLDRSPHIIRYEWNVHTHIAHLLFYPGVKLWILMSFFNSGNNRAPLPLLWRLGKHFGEKSTGSTRGNIHPDSLVIRYNVFIKYCVFSKILKYIPDSLAALGFPAVSVSVHNGRSNTSAAAELAEFRKITTFKGKTQYLMNTLYLRAFVETHRIQDSCPSGKTK